MFIFSCYGFLVFFGGYYFVIRFWLGVERFRVGKIFRGFLFFDVGEVVSIFC